MAYDADPISQVQLTRIALRDHIAKHPEEFDMGSFECGTTACMAGHVGRMHGDPWLPFGNRNLFPWVDRQVDRLGLTDGRDAFCHTEASQPEVLAFLDHLIETNEEVWA